MRNLANAITLLRFGLVPMIAWNLIRGEALVAFVLLAVSALSDVVDGVVARHWSGRTRFGAIADPLADKLTMATVALILAFQGALPWWFVAAAVTRDAVIVGGAFAYHRFIGPLEIAPSRISKLNTALEFLLVNGVLAIEAELLPDGPWRVMLLSATLATIVVSGLQYVLVWTRKALEARRAARQGP